MSPQPRSFPIRCKTPLSRSLPFGLDVIDESLPSQDSIKAAAPLEESSVGVSITVPT